MHTIAVVNEKGGTAKTTTSVNLAAALGEAGHRTLLVDLDGQAASSRWLGVEEDHRLAEAIIRGEGLQPIEGVLPGLDLAPASGRLDSIAHELRPTQGGQLRKLINQMDGRYEFVLIDCPPSLGNRLIGNALLAANYALVPVEPSILALDGLRMLLTTLADVRDGFDHAIGLLGVVACRFDPRTRLSRLVLAELHRALPNQVFATVVHETVRMQECPASGTSILGFAPDCSAAGDYRALAQELLAGGPAIDAESPAVEDADLLNVQEIDDEDRRSVLDFRRLTERYRCSDPVAETPPTQPEPEADVQAQPEPEPQVEVQVEVQPEPQSEPEVVVEGKADATDEADHLAESADGEQAPVLVIELEGPEQTEPAPPADVAETSSDSSAGADAPAEPQAEPDPQPEPQPAAPCAVWPGPEDIEAVQADSTEAEPPAAWSPRPTSRMRMLALSAAGFTLLLATALGALTAISWYAGPQSAEAEAPAGTAVVAPSPLAAPSAKPAEPARRVDAKVAWRDLPSDLRELASSAVRSLAGVDPVTGRVQPPQPAPTAEPDEPVPATETAAPSADRPTAAAAAEEAPTAASADRPAEPQAEPQAEPAKAVAASPARQVPRPSLKVTGIVYQQGRRMAIVNDEVVAVGDDVDGARVTRIGSRTVHVQVHGQPFVFGIGESVWTSSRSGGSN